MNIIISWFEKRAINRYRTRFHGALVRDHGSFKYYLPEQIETTLARTRMGGAHAIFAFGIYCRPESFDAYVKQNSLSWDYKDTREKIANTFFKGNTHYKQDDLLIIMYGSHGSDTHGGNVDSGGGFE